MAEKEKAVEQPESDGESMKEENKPLTLHEKLCLIQGRLKAPKNQFNKFGGYHYRSCEDILEALKPLLEEYGLALFMSDEIIQIGDRYYLKSSVALSDGNHIYEVKAYAREAATKKGMDESQITGAASSYARKYALNGLFCIDDQRDADATNKHGQEKGEGKAPEEDDETRAKRLLDRMEQVKNIFELRNWWKKHSAEITNLPEEYKATIREMKEALKVKFEKENKKKGGDK